MAAKTQKFWTVATSPSAYETYEVALEAAQRKAKDGGYDHVYIMESKAVVKTPVPNYEVVSY